ncbi:MAG: hypothetical protein ACAI25_04645 [Planctomycetota bacterium]
MQTFLNYFVWAPGEVFPRYVGPYWILIAFCAVVLILLLLGTFFVTKWISIRNRSKNRLRRIWTSFLKNIPGEFRRYIMLYQPFVVFGESGSGKSSLIGRYTDWKGQAAQFYPSYNVDPLLQIYLGSRSLVQEVPSTLLAETSANARGALVRLWQPIFRTREPIAVITISAAALRKATPESLRSQAQVLRGKINVLSNIANKPIQARLVLTHMDQVEGYLAYSQFVEKNDVPHQLQLDPKAPDGNLAHCLEAQEKYLPIALTTLSAPNYLKVLTFLNKAPETFENLAALLRALKEPDPLSFEPRVEDLYLTSDQGGSPSAVSNPFAASWTDHHVALEKAMVRRHSRITAAIAIFGLVYFLAAFAFEWRQLRHATSTVADFEGAKIKGELAHEAASRVREVEGAQTSLVNWVLPSFFHGTTADLKRRYVKTVRENYLRPLYKELDNRQVTNPVEFALFLTALLYSSNDSALGRFILDPADTEERRIAEFAHAFTIGEIERIPRGVIKAYIQLSDEPYGGKYDELPPTIPHQTQHWHGVTDKTNWIKLVESVNSWAVPNKMITPEDLDKLKEQAAIRRADFDSLLRRSTGQKVFTILKTDPRFPVALFEKYDAEVKMPTWLDLQQRNLNAVLDLVLDSKRSTLSFEAPPGSAAPLEDLNGEIDAIRKRTVEPSPPILIQFHEPGPGEDQRPPTQVSRTAWDQMINDSRVQTSVDRFCSQYADARSKIFFSKIGERTWERPIVMKPGTASDFAFKGQFVVPPEFTRAFYERAVQARLKTFDEIFKKKTVTEGVVLTAKQDTIAIIDTTAPRVAPVVLDANLHDKLNELVENAADEYATAYNDWWTRFYRSWSVEAKDVNTARTIFSQMSLPASRFQDFLTKIRSNTSYESSESKKLNVIFEKLSEFQKINKLQDTDRGQNPEIDKYRTILRGVVADLDGAPADKSKDAVGAVEMRRVPLEFTELLSPAGRISFAILHKSRDSKLVTIEDWLKANGIQDEWKRPFLEPVERLHLLGIQDIEELIQRSWQRRVLSQAIPLLEKFPFNRNAVSEATTKVCTDVLLPSTGLFWVAWRNLIAPVCVQDGDSWKPMKGLENVSSNPKGMFEVVSALTKVTQTLWDKDSVPKVLKFGIQPQTLPITRSGKPAIVTSFIQVGASSVFGFNQKLYDQTLTIEWWTGPPASIGMQVGDPGSHTKSYRSINEPESAWSFYRLLLRDRHAEQNMWVWDLTQGEPEYPAPILKFQFKQDPWEIFSVPGFDKKEETK